LSTCGRARSYGRLPATASLAAQYLWSRSLIRPPSGDRIARRSVLVVALAHTAAFPRPHRSPLSTCGRARSYGRLPATASLAAQYLWSRSLIRPPSGDRIARRSVLVVALAHTAAFRRPHRSPLSTCGRARSYGRLPATASLAAQYLWSRSLIRPPSGDRIARRSVLVVALAHTAASRRPHRSPLSTCGRARSYGRLPATASLAAQYLWSRSLIRPPSGDRIARRSVLVVALAHTAAFRRPHRSPLSTCGRARSYGRLPATASLAAQYLWSRSLIRPPSGDRIARRSVLVVALAHTAAFRRPHRSPLSTCGRARSYGRLPATASLAAQYLWSRSLIRPPPG